MTLGVSTVFVFGWVMLAKVSKLTLAAHKKLFRVYFSIEIALLCLFTQEYKYSDL